MAGEKAAAKEISIESSADVRSVELLVDTRNSHSIPLLKLTAHLKQTKNEQGVCSNIFL
jgi:hypothetical protein